MTFTFDDRLWFLVCDRPSYQSNAMMPFFDKFAIHSFLHCLESVHVWPHVSPPPCRATQALTWPPGWGERWASASDHHRNRVPLPSANGCIIAWPREGKPNQTKQIIFFIISPVWSMLMSSAVSFCRDIMTCYSLSLSLSLPLLSTTLLVRCQPSSLLLWSEAVGGWVGKTLIDCVSLQISLFLFPTGPSEPSINIYTYTSNHFRRIFVFRFPFSSRIWLLVHHFLNVFQ